MIAEALMSGKRIWSLVVNEIVIASEAKQSMPQQAERWIASSLRSSQ
jgi:hypothetical protein